MKEDILALQCCKCAHTKQWHRHLGTTPGRCWCGSGMWLYLKEMPARPRGFVKLMTYQGTQELKGPHYREDPNAWRRP